jgi:preprotein translocase subunit SecY
MYRNKLDIYHTPIRFYTKYNILPIASVIYLNLCIIAFIFFLFFYMAVNVNEKVVLSKVS